MPYLEREETSIYYQTHTEKCSNDSSWVTLINGHGRTHSDFKQFIRSLNQAGYRCLSLDNRGVGNTKIHKEFSLHDIADDIVRLWQQLNIEQSHILGISMGGVIAQLIAIKYEEKLSSLTLVSTTNSKTWISKISDEPWGADLESIVSKLNHYFAPSFSEKNKLLISAMAKGIKNNIDNPDLMRGMQLQRNAINKIAENAYLSLFKRPMLIIHGSDDKIIRINAARDIKNNNPKAELIELQHVGHLILAEAAKTLYESYIKFLNTI